MSDNFVISLVDQWHYKSQSTKIIVNNFYFSSLGVIAPQWVLAFLHTRDVFF